MARIKYQQEPGKGRGRGFFPQLTGMRHACERLSEQTTDRGLTGPAVRDADDARARISKQQAKLARRAARAHGGGNG
jgi:hypothetical protein